MLTLVLKNVWARRRRNGWLFAELLAVVVVSWVILDQVVVNTYVRSLPMGYDHERLVLVSLGRYTQASPQYAAEADTLDVLFEDVRRLAGIARELGEVEEATPLIGFAYPSSSGNSWTSISTETDTARAVTIYYEQNSAFFRTYGFEPAGGYTLEQLDRDVRGDNEVVLSQNLYDRFFSGSQQTGEPTITTSQTGQPLKVKGVVKPIKMYNQSRPVPVMCARLLSGFYADETLIPERTSVLVRLKDGVSRNAFLRKFQEEYAPRLYSGNLYARTAVGYDKIIARSEASEMSTIWLNTVLAAFFLVNLCLGVTGTFWLQTKIRKRDVGVMLSFGATPRHILTMLLGEGACLCTLAVLLGSLGFLQYALSEGLYIDYLFGQTDLLLMPSWIDSFAPHFLLVAGVIYALVMAVVLTGIYIPARRISRLHPTEALRDE